MIKISVIMPVYNAEKFLKTAIQSVIKQSYKKIEIILVDDGSTDKSCKICDDYAKKDRRIKIIHQKNSGPSASRNTGIKNAKGEFIFFTDADDFLEEDALSLLIESADQHQAEIIIGDFQNIKNGQLELRQDFSFLGNKLLKKEDLLSYARLYLKKPNRYLLLACSWGRLFKSSIIKDNHLFFEEKLQTFEDVAFNFTYLKYAKTAFFVKKTIYSHRVYDDYLSATRSIGSNPKKLFGYQQALFKIRNFLENNLTDKEIKKEIGHAYIFLTIIQLVRMCGQINCDNIRRIFQAIQELTHDATLQKNLQYYFPAKGDSKILPLLLKLKLVWPTIFVCRYKARQRYGKRHR